MLKHRSKSPLAHANNENSSGNGSDPNRDHQITLLRRKLVETHNKLLEQLDYTKQLELKLMGLSRATQDAVPHTTQERSDFEALRTKILTEMLEKNKAKDEAKTLGQRLLQKEEELVVAQEQLQASHHEQSLLEKRYEVLKQRFQQHSLELDKQMRNSQTLRLELSSCRGKIVQMEQKTRQEQTQSRDLQEANRQLSGRLSSLQAKFDELEEHNLTLKNKFLLDSREKAQIQSKTLQMEKLTAENNRLAVQLRQRERELSDLRIKASLTPKKRDFDETRQLIFKLEEAERETRNRQSPSNNVINNNQSSETIKQKLSSSRKQRRQVTFEHSFNEQRKR